MKKEIYRANSRGGADHGWLKTRHSFSFADYYDPERMGFGALRVLNDDEIAPARGFGKHGHSNMEIITIPLEGAVTHGDSMGNQGQVRVGEVQIMSAGSGVVHSEENKDPEVGLKLLQIWIETDSQYANITPRYKQQGFEESERQNAWQLLVSPPNESPLDIMQNAWIWRARLDPGRKLSYELRTLLRSKVRSSTGVYIFVIEGVIEGAGEKLERRDALSLREIETLEIVANTASDVLLLEVPLES